MLRFTVLCKIYLIFLLAAFCAGCGTFIAERRETEGQKKLPPVFTLKEISKYPLSLSFLRNYSYFDMVWNGKNLFIGTQEGKVYRINTENGATVENIYSLGIGKISAMGWDGSHMWVATMGDGKIVRFNQIGDISAFAVDRIFNIKGADTYPYAMAIDGEDLYTGGYNKSLIHYKIKGFDELVKANEINLERRLQALTIVEGRIFLVDIARNKFAEIVNGKIKYFPIKNFQRSISGLAYDGQYFWTLSEDGLIKYEVLEAREKKEESNVIIDSQINLESYVYPPGRPMGVVRDGNTIWTMSAVGLNRGFYSHSMDPYLSITGDFLPEVGRVNITYGYGSFAWDGEYFLTIGSKQADFNKVELYLVKFKPVAQKDSRELKIEGTERLFLGDRKWVEALTRVDGYLWVSSGQNTRVSGEGSFIYKMQRNHEGDWEIAGTFKAPGARCQGLAWDGENLWSYDVFNGAFYKHRMDDNLTVLKTYGSIQGRTLNYFSGMTWDGKNFWAGNYSPDRIYKITFK